MKPQAIFWDCDGTLVDTEGIYIEATIKILEKYNVGITADFIIEEALNKGKTPFLLASKAGYSEEEIQHMREERKTIAEELVLDLPLKPIDGIVEVLDFYKGKIPMYVVTANYRKLFELIMSKTGLMHYFDFAITACDVTTLKPDPEAYIKAVERSGHNPALSLAIEDTVKGVAAAQAAGLKCFAIPNHLSKTGDFSQADRVLTDVTELLHLWD